MNVKIYNAVGVCQVIFISPSCTTEDLKVNALRAMGYIRADMEDDECEKSSITAKYKLLKIPDVKNYKGLDQLSGGKNLVLNNSLTLGKQEIRDGSELMLIRKQQNIEGNKMDRSGRITNLYQYLLTPSMNDIEKATAELPIRNADRRVGRLNPEDILQLRDEEQNTDSNSMA
ncbi:unnamed protein product [Gordionus sp. m RMFG-2023]|uniref:uncharacterized protein LOC135931610 n=1 Tax=Gordionus sp. m RMFG-2023 TaxID=3053472 RepID=UPI0030E49197